MFQVPADQKETDLVGRSIVHKSAYKQATGKFHVCHKKINCPLFLNAIHAVLFFVFMNFFKYFIWDLMWMLCKIVKCYFSSFEAA
jgi:hypothetical protein